MFRTFATSLGDIVNFPSKTSKTQTKGHTNCFKIGRRAVVAQLVEHQLPKLRVASSSLVCRSKTKRS